MAESAVIRGSWEDLLLQAQGLAAKQDDAALAIYRKLTERLSKLPPGQRQAGAGRLQGVLRQAAVDLQYYLTFREQYEEAIAVNEQVRMLLGAEEHKAFVRHAAAIRLQAGEVEEGLAELRAIAAASDELDPWGDALFAAVDKGRYEDAQEAVDSAEAWVNRHHREALNSEEAKRDQAFVAYLKARKAAAERKGAEALAWFQFAAAQDPFYRHNPQYVYTHLVDVGAYGEAQTLIRTDKEGPIRANFWQGLIYFRSGRDAEAQTAWRKAVTAGSTGATQKADATGTEEDAKQDDSGVDYLELVLAHYYLGDHDGVGLGSVLRAIQENPDFWGLFYLAGLGWALRNDMTAARADMELALVRRKSLAEGRKLARTWWPFCTDLLDPEKQAQIVEYFDHAEVQRRA
jgi:tetratricopeptide (TPR) repeat protein